MPTNRKGLGIKTTQSFIKHTHNHLTSKKLLTPLQNIAFYQYLLRVNSIKIATLGGNYE